MSSSRSIRKIGTIDCNMVETTPIVFRNRLYRFEYVRENYKSNEMGKPRFRFIDVELGEPTPPFASGYHLGSAYVEDERVFVYGVNAWGGSEIKVFWSDDLRCWQSQIALQQPGWGIYNNSVCKGRDRYVMAIELGESLELVGVRFTIFFAESEDLLNWRPLPPDRVFSRDRYTACPALRFINDYCYVIYLEERPGPTYESHIVRSKDLIHWHSSPYNPIMHFSNEDKRIANPKLTAEQRELVANAVNINNSDVDLCEFKGKTIIYYSWGNQRGIEFLAEAVYDGPMDEFLEDSFQIAFPNSMKPLHRMNESARISHYGLL